MKHNSKLYKYWVVVAGKIVGGNEYREDAVEHANDINTGYWASPVPNTDSGRWPHLGIAKVYARAGLKRLWIDPDKNSDWGEPAEWTTHANPSQKIMWRKVSKPDEYDVWVDESGDRMITSPFGRRGPHEMSYKGVPFDSGKTLTEAKKPMFWRDIQENLEAVGHYFPNPAGLPPSVERYVEETKAQSPGIPEARAWAIAWSRYCKYKNPDSPHCHLERPEYFPGRGGTGSLPNPAQIIPFPVDRSAAITKNADSARLVSTYLGSQVQAVLVTEGAETAAAFEPGTLLIFAGPGATAGTRGSLDRLGAITDENGGFVPLDRAAVFHGNVSMALAQAQQHRPTASKPLARSAHFPVKGVDASFQNALDEYIAFAQKLIDEDHRKSFPNLTVPVLSAQDGRRYIRIIRGDGSFGKSAHAFVDKQTGDILKPASWKAPAKHARGNILRRDYAKWTTSAGSPAYLR